MANQKILIVDDEPDFVKLLSFDLRKRGYEVIIAEDGEKGLAKIGSDKPDLIIIDVKMPKMDGYTLVRNIKKNPEWSSIPLIAMTAYDSLRDLLEIEGIKHFFVKSAQMNELLEVVAQYLPPETNPEE